MIAVAGGSGVTGPSDAATLSHRTDAPAVTGQAWQPLAYGEAEIVTPTSWPVVYPGVSECGASLEQGVVLLGAFGSSTWCHPGTTSAPVAPLPNVVRFAPLVVQSSSYLHDPSRIIDGSRVYQGVLHGSVAGTVYLDPSLGVELMASGPLVQRVIDSLAPSLRDVVLRDRTTASIPASWRWISFAGLRFAVPSTWSVSRSALSTSCGPIDTTFSTPLVVLDNDTLSEMIPCPYIPPARLGSDGLRIDAGSATAPNLLPKSSQRFVLNGLQMYVDQTHPFSVLVVEIELPGRAMPVEVRIGLGTARIAAAILRSMKAA